MGLVFALQPDLRKSKPGHTLVLKTSKRRFSLGAGLFFGAALLGTMYTAAKPLFEVLWNEGGFFDKILTAFIVGSIVIYPLVALLSWSLEETVILEKTNESAERPLKIKKFFSLLGFKWGQKSTVTNSLSEFKIENWKGALNMAALNEKSAPNRYATKGHWILRAAGIDLEKRAKRDDIEILKTQIENFFRLG